MVIDMEDRDILRLPWTVPHHNAGKGRSSSNSRRRIVVGVPNHPATPPTTATLVGQMELFLGFASLRTARHLALGHVTGKTTDVVLEDLVLVFQLVVVRLDRINALGKSLEGGLESLGLPVSITQKSISVQLRRGRM